DFERGVQMLELGDIVPLKMLARFRPRVERRGEDAPVLDPILKIRDVGRAELEKELADAPALGSGLECDVQIRLTNSSPWHKSESGLEIVADLLPRQCHVPTIDRLVDRKITNANTGYSLLFVGTEHIQGDNQYIDCAKD